MNYTNGSPCPAKPFSKRSDDLLSPRRKIDDDDDDDDDERRLPVRRKGTIISLLCDRDPLAPTAAVSFIGTLDECSYQFEVRSPAACGGVSDTQAGVGPGGVFGIMWVLS